MKKLQDSLVCPLHDKCNECDELLGGLPSVAVLTDAGKRLYHVMCAPVNVRKAYHEQAVNHG